MGVIIYTNNKKLRYFVSSIGYRIEDYSKNRNTANQYIYCCKYSNDAYDESQDDYFPVERAIAEIDDIGDESKRIYKNDIQCGIDEEMFKVEAKKEIDRD